jgi:glycosyltransferase involved in cell wall biosynthesis
MAGGIRVASIYADRLQRRGHEVVVVSTPNPHPSLRRKLKYLVFNQSWPKGPPPRWPSYFDSLSVEHRVIDSHRPVTEFDVPDADVVVATWWETAEWVNRLSRAKGAKAYLIQHHELLFENQPADRVAATWRMPLHKITISNWLTELARRVYQDADVSHVPNSVDMNQFHAPPRGRQSQPTVGFLYSPTPFKGTATTIEAIRRATVEMPELRSIAFSNNAVSDAMPLPPGCAFNRQPAQDKIRDLYAACDVWLCGSKSEGFHLPPLEAMACRCPVVSTRVGGPVDTISEGLNGHLVDVGDATGLADRLLQVLRMPDKQWQAMSDAAYATASEYTWDNATDRFEKALERAIERGRIAEEALA